MAGTREDIIQYGMGDDARERMGLKIEITSYEMTPAAMEALGFASGSIATESHDEVDCSPYKS